MEVTVREIFSHHAVRLHLSVLTVLALLLTYMCVTSPLAYRMALDSLISMGYVLGIVVAVYLAYGIAGMLTGMYQYIKSKLWKR